MWLLGDKHALASTLTSIKVIFYAFKNDPQEIQRHRTLVQIDKTEHNQLAQNWKKNENNQMRSINLPKYWAGRTMSWRSHDFVNWTEQYLATPRRRHAWLTLISTQRPTDMTGAGRQLEATLRVMPPVWSAQMQCLSSAEFRTIHLIKSHSCQWYCACFYPALQFGLLNRIW